MQSQLVIPLPPLPEAPNTTSKGKTTTQHSVSYKPFIHSCSAPPMRGIAKSGTRIKLQIQNAPLICKDLNTLDKNKPAVNENKRRSEPAVNSVSVSEKPAQISPKGPNIAKAANPIPNKATSPANTLVENLRIINAYRILPMYSKNNDQLGPFNGNISPSPLTSCPGMAGINKAFKRVAIASEENVTLVTSQTEHP